MFLELGEIAGGSAGDVDDVLDAHAADARVVEAGFDGDDLAGAEEVGERGLIRGASWMSRPRPWPVP